MENCLKQQEDAPSNRNPFRRSSGRHDIPSGRYHRKLTAPQEHERVAPVHRSDIEQYNLAQLVRQTLLKTIHLIEDTGPKYTDNTETDAVIHI